MSVHHGEVADSDGEWFFLMADEATIQNKFVLYANFNLLRLTSDQGPYDTQVSCDSSVEYRNPDPGKKSDYQMGRISISDSRRN